MADARFEGSTFGLASLDCRPLLLSRLFELLDFVHIERHSVNNVLSCVHRSLCSFKFPGNVCIFLELFLALSISNLQVFLQMCHCKLSTFRICLLLLLHVHSLVIVSEIAKSSVSECRASGLAP